MAIRFSKTGIILDGLKSLRTEKRYYYSVAWEIRPDAEIEAIARDRELFPARGKTETHRFPSHQFT
jgi:hypothetical protein